MSQRIFILGGGRFGTHLASRLCEFGCEVIIADADPERVQDLTEDGYNAIEIDGDDAGALKAAGVRDADAVVVAIGENMQANILATLLLKDLKVKKLIARATDDKHAQVLEKLEADLVVVPDRDMAYRLAERLRSDSLAERVPLMADYQLAHVQLGPALDGKTLAEAKLPAEYNVNVVLINRPEDGERTRHIEPGADVTLRRNDVIIVVGKRDRIVRMEKDFGVKQ